MKLMDISHSNCTQCVSSLFCSVILCSILAPALEVSVESSTSTRPSDTVEVLCTANDAEMVKWSVSGVSQFLRCVVAIYTIK